MIKHQPSILQARLNGRGAAASCLVDVPKENFATRPAVVLDPIDRLAYQAIVGRVSKTLIGRLNPNVFGWRLPRTNPRPGKYARNDREWEKYRTHISELANQYDAALKTDVVSCFASIPVDRLCAQIEQRLSSAGLDIEADRLNSFLQSWDKVPGRSGIPQRCQASSVLANFYLSRIDDVLVDVSKERWPSKGGARSFARWMDDIWIFGDDAGQLRLAQIEIQKALAPMGLHLNVAKTKLLEGSAVVEQVLKLEHSAIDEGLASSPTDTGPLNALIRKIVEDRETANRTTVRFVAERMKTHKRFRKLKSIQDVSHRMPHVADHLGRLFRDSRRAVRMQDWFLDYRSSPWGKVEWPVAQFATMFPSERKLMSKGLIDHLANELAGNAKSLPLLALAAQRLAAWSPRVAIQAIEAAIQRVSGPLERRVLALAGLNAGAPTSQVQQWLTDFPENAVTVNMLNEMSFVPLAYELDFAGD
ncbi:reverse transcriptase domain-containing protein [Micromonospora sp. NPDC049366]|uniref:RNA-directed DNA polymerase n=1 Tax=Micromonospora sp. NPDC049366 TaxID=3364271 RepID=UPI00379C1651